ncbi:unannotated protein [freshwater metagenome]|uniref:Unannotated protein n=1 Tax=freshwater metagenome TaxID=449393 RepID=A0A6J7ILW8_9ZZZZ
MEDPRPGGGERARANYDVGMSDLQRRSGTRLTRKQRETRAYRLTLATGGLGVVGAVLLVLGVVGIGSAGAGVLLLVLAAISGFLLKSTLGK